MFPGLALAMLLWLAPANAADPTASGEPLIVSQDHVWPPFAFRDEKGQPRGLLVDLWREIGQRLGRPVEFRLVDWPESIAQVRDGRAHVHGGLIPSPERRAFLEFSTQLMPLETFLFVASGSPAMRLSDLGGAGIGVTEGSFEMEFMRREHPEMELRAFRNNELMILAAVRGEIDAFVADYPVGLYLLDRHATPADFRPMISLYKQPLVAGVRRGDTGLRNAIDTALADFDDEDLRRLLQRWLRSEKVEVLPAWVLPATAAMLIIALLALFGLMMYRQRCHLAREVKARTEELRAGEAKFRALVENANDIIYTMAPDGTLTYVSPNWTEILGHDTDEIIDQPFDPFVHPDDLPKCNAFLKLVFQTGAKQGGIEYRVRNKQGEWRWHTSNAAPILDASGNVIAYMGIARDITERKDVEARMERLAHHDPLTDLPNRLLFFDRAHQALNLASRAGSRMALMLLDLDQFKPVNDDCGHAVGDLLLQEAARRMKTCLRSSDTVGRIGGDEFVILLPVIEHEQDALQVAEKILEALRQPFRIAGEVLDISCSIGIALYPEHGASVAELSKHADYAMYVVKKRGRDACLIYRDEMLDEARPGAIAGKPG
jgi:diguanylate cyclase (GGDEF)-like protein/PAS domain S-box-containing protein